MQTQNKSSSSLDLNIILLITLICLSISFYQTGMGYSKLFGAWPLSFAFAFVLVLFMFLQNQRLMQRVSTGKAAGGILGVYLILTMASLGGNFNSFYSKFMGSELIREELETKRDSLIHIQDRAHSVLANKETDRFEADVNSEIDQLKLQIANEGNPGVGPKSRAILSDLQTKLGINFTDLRAKSTSGTDLKDIGEQYAAMIKQGLNTKLGALNHLQRNQLIADIDDRVKNALLLVDQAAKDTRNTPEGLEAINKAVQEYKYIGSKTLGMTDNYKFKYDDTFEVKNGRLGEIDHAIRSAFAHLGAWGTWLALFISLLIDFIPPMIILGMVQPEEDDRRNLPRKPTPTGVTILNN